MGFSRTVKRGLLDHFFSKTSYSPPTEFFVGVSSTTPTSTGSNILEPADAAYARQSTLVADWDATLDEDPVVVKNNIQIDFAQATEDWFNGDDILCIVLFDSLTAGNMIGFGTYARTKPIYQDDIFIIEVDKLLVSLT